MKTAQSPEQTCLFQLDCSYQLPIVTPSLSWQMVGFLEYVVAIIKWHRKKETETLFFSFPHRFSARRRLARSAETAEARPRPIRRRAESACLGRQLARRTTAENALFHLHSSRACLGRERSILYATGSRKAVFSTISFASLLLKSSTATGRVVLFSGSSPHYKKIHLSFLSTFLMFVPSLSW